MIKRKFKINFRDKGILVNFTALVNGFARIKTVRNQGYHSGQVRINTFSLYLLLICYPGKLR